ncbi:MAG: Ppx/GppA family phosphatase [Rhodospirillaceae bacterium]|nr:Ppx/GppA family phosphatase [Rhodospirillaceae bacterium]
MLIARPDGHDLTAADGFSVVDGFSRIVRLGEGLGRSGELSPDAMDRTLEALSICANKIAARRAQHTRCIATEACRRASNSTHFVDRVTQETGIAIDIISPEREAELTLLGCSSLLNTGHERALLFDIGGGSTEIQWVEIPRHGNHKGRPKALDVISLPVGVVTLAEQHGIGAMTPEIYNAIMQEIGDHLEAFSTRNGIDACIAEGSVQMLGTSGTVTTLGALHLDLPRYERSRVDGLVIDFDAISTMCARLSELDHAERRDISCIGRGRADLMLMGCALLRGICRRWPIGKLGIADRGIREGLLAEMMQAPGMDASGASVLPVSAPI